MEQPTDDELLKLENEQIVQEASEYVWTRMTVQQQIMWAAGDRPPELDREVDAAVAYIARDNAGTALVWAGLYEMIEDTDGAPTYYRLGEPDKEAGLKAINDYRRWQFGHRE